MKNDYEFQIKLITINEKHFKQIDEKLKNSQTFKYIQNISTQDENSIDYNDLVINV